MPARWQHVHAFTRGMADGYAWGHSSAEIPWLLQNCRIDGGKIITRRGHTDLSVDSAGPILNYVRWGANNYRMVKSGSASGYAGLIGRDEGGTFSPKNVYDTGTVAVSGNAVTFTGATNMPRLLLSPQRARFRYVYTGSTWSNWLAVTSVDSDATMTIVSAPGDNSGADYELAICGAEFDYGSMVQCGPTYVVGLAGGAPIVYDAVKGKAWQAGIPAPDAPSGTFAAGSPDVGSNGWYGYAAAWYDVENGVYGRYLSSRLAVQATSANYAIDVRVQMGGYAWMARIPNKWVLTFWRTEEQSSEADAGTATLYYLGEVTPSLTATYATEEQMFDMAFDSNVDNTRAWSAGTANVGCLPPVGEFRAPDGDVGYVAYVAAYKLHTGEVGPVGPRHIIAKATTTDSVHLTVSGQVWYTVGMELYRTKTQTTFKEAEEAEMFYLGVTGTTYFEDTGDDDNVNDLLPSPTETSGWTETNDMTGLLYWAGRIAIWGGDNWVRLSGLPQGGRDIGFNRGTGLDEPNYWSQAYQCGFSNEVVKACVVFNRRLYGLTPSGTYVLDTSDPLADYWAFANVSQGYGCSEKNMAAGGQLGIYSVTADTDGITRIIHISADGRVTVVNNIQKTINAVSSWYCITAHAGRVYISTDQGLIVIEETTLNARVDTGITPRCFSIVNGVLYSGDADGKVYTLYSKAKGTIGDEGAYEWKVQSGAFAPGGRIHPGTANRFYARFENTDASNAETVTAKVTTDGYDSYVQDETPADWTQTITVPADTKDYIQDYPILMLVDGTMIGLELYGTGSYGDLALCGIGMQHGEPKVGQIGTTL